MVECPEHSTQKGPDCFCNAGFEVDTELARCVPAANNETDENIDNEYDPDYVNDDSSNFLVIGLGCCCCSALIIIIVIIIILLLRKKKAQSQEVIKHAEVIPPTS